MNFWLLPCKIGSILLGSSDVQHRAPCGVVQGEGHQTVPRQSLPPQASVLVISSYHEW